VKELDLAGINHFNGMLRRLIPGLFNIGLVNHGVTFCTCVTKVAAKKSISRQKALGVHTVVLPPLTGFSQVTSAGQRISRQIEGKE
jgi:hypothetical protein